MKTIKTTVLTNLTDRTGRTYNRAEVEAELAKYRESIQCGGAFGELGHSSDMTVHLDRVSHRIVDAHLEGDDLIVEAIPLNSPFGKIVRAFLDEEVGVRLMLRGMGKVNKDNVVSEFKIVAFDVGDSIDDPKQVG